MELVSRPLWENSAGARQAGARAGWRAGEKRMGHREPNHELDGESARSQLERILASQTFARAGRLSRLLRFTVEQAIEGQADCLKEYSLGTQVFGRDESFDPRVDPVVRVEVHRLRARLGDYYQNEGRDDLLLIEFPKGGYAPVLRRRPAPRRALDRARAWMATPRRVWALALGGLVVAAVAGYWIVASRKEAPPPLSSMLVLPFEDVSPQRDQEYFCDGMTEELVNSLAQVPGLRLVSRTAAAQFRGKAIDLRSAGRQLGAAMILEGSVRKEGNKLRITARLVRAADGYHIWSGDYDRELTQVFAIQREIACAIVNALRLQFAATDQTRRARPRAVGLDAYNAYLKGRYHWGKRTEGGLQTSITHFEQAIAADPEYGAAHAGLADAYALLASYGVAAPNEVMPKAKSAARRALALDDSLAEAHTSLGFILSFYDWDWSAAEREYRRAIELDPGYPTARQWYSGYLRAAGRLEEALSQMQRAQDLDPLSLPAGRDMGRIFASMRRFDQAIEQYRRALELDPDSPTVHLHLGMAYQGKRMYKEAVAAFEKARSLPGANPLVLGALGYGYAAGGARREAEKLIEELDALSTRRYVSPVSRVFIYAGLGDKDRSFQWLDRACQNHDPWLLWLQAESIFDSLRDDPRFSILLKTVGLRR
jgi:serine/threonine-protein kinase